MRHVLIVIVLSAGLSWMLNAVPREKAKMEAEIDAAETELIDSTLSAEWLRGEPVEIDKGAAARQP